MKKYYSLVAVLVLAFSVFSAANVARSADAGDVIINEFSSASETEWVELMNTTDNPIDLNGWTIQDLANPPESLSDLGSIPARGLVVFERPSGWLNDDPDPIETITIFDDSENAIDSVNYGSGEEAAVSEPDQEESAAFNADEESWSIGDPTKGWFNDAGEEGKAPLLEDIADMLDDEDIESNIGDLDNPSATPDNEDDGALYFDAGDGRVVFEQQLNLTDQAFVELLESLAELMEMSENFVYFDSELAEAMSAAGARIYVYDLGELELEDNFTVIVRNDEGEIIDPDDEDYPEISEQNYEDGTVSFVVSHFSQFEVDLPVTNETTGNKYPTIEDALDDAEDGDTIRVASGTYEEDELEIRQEGLTLKGDVGDDTPGPGDNAPEIIGDDCDDRVIRIEADNVVVKGFKLTGEGCKPVVWLDWDEDGEENISGVEISDNEISNGKKGVDLTPFSNNNLVTNNIIRDNNYEGVWIGGSTDNTISNNEIYGNSTGVGLGAGGCDEDCVDDVSGNEITGNHIHDNEDDDSGIHLSNVSFSELTISDNTIADNGGYGIYFDRVFESILTISGNEVTGNSAAGVYISGNSGTISDSTVLLENNTISDNSYEGVYISQVDNESTLDFIGNTITDNGIDEEDEGDDYAGVYINNVFESMVTFEDNTISDNAGSGVYMCSEGDCSFSTLTFEGNTIEDNNIAGIYLYYVYNSTVLVDDNNISDNDETGIYVWNIDQGQEEEEEPGSSTLTITNNTIAGNGEGGDERTGIHLANINGGLVMINFNAITDNDGGLYVGENDTENSVDATNNWWGDASGPANEENEDGEGDGVGGDVLFSPWLATLNLSGNNPVVGKIINSNGSAVGGDTGVKIKFEATGDNPAETATKDIESDDPDDQALYEVDIDGPNAGLTTVTGMALFANRNSTLTGELEVVGIAEEEEEEENGGGGTSSSGSRARSQGTTTPGSAGEEGEVLGEEKFVFTLFLKKGPPYLSSQSNEVMELQKLLNSLGFGPLVVDGKFGPLTEAAVKAFQAAHPPLVVDGIVGPLTRAVLNQ